MYNCSKIHILCNHKYFTANRRGSLKVWKAEQWDVLKGTDSGRFCLRAPLRFSSWPASHNTQTWPVRTGMYLRLDHNFGGDYVLLNFHSVSASEHLHELVGHFLFLGLSLLTWQIRKWGITVVRSEGMVFYTTCISQLIHKRILSTNTMCRAVDFHVMMSPK